MSIEIKTDNCCQDNYYLIEEAAMSELNIKLSFEKVVTMQSKNKRQLELCDFIQAELKKFKWIIAGSVQIELIWYLNSIERQETDKVGDLDNITKPILDSLVGINGILIDDAQIGSIHTFWQSRNDQVEDNVLYIKLSFNNDECLWKNGLVFIQYSKAICVPFNVDFSCLKSMYGARSVIKSRIKQRKAAGLIKQLGSNVDRFLVQSSWDFHRTRLSGFDSAIIYTNDQFALMCKNNGLSFCSLLKLFRANRKERITNAS